MVPRFDPSADGGLACLTQSTRGYSGRTIPPARRRPLVRWRLRRKGCTLGTTGPAVDGTRSPRSSAPPRRFRRPRSRRVDRCDSLVEPDVVCADRRRRVWHVRRRPLRDTGRRPPRLVRHQPIELEGGGQAPSRFARGRGEGADLRLSVGSGIHSSPRRRRRCGPVVAGSVKLGIEGRCSHAIALGAVAVGVVLVSSELLRAWDRFVAADALGGRNGFASSALFVLLLAIVRPSSVEAALVVQSISLIVPAIVAVFLLRRMLCVVRAKGRAANVLSSGSPFVGSQLLLLVNGMADVWVAGLILTATDAVDTPWPREWQGL